MNIQSEISKILNYSPAEDEKKINIDNYGPIYANANGLIKKVVGSENINLMLVAAFELAKICFSLDSRDYLLLDARPVVPREVYIEGFFNLGTLLKMTVERLIQTRQIELGKNNAMRTTNDADLILNDFEHEIFNKSLGCFNAILSIDFENQNAIKQITSIYTHLVLFSQQNLQKACHYLNQSLFYSPDSPLLHYNLGHIYQRLNDLPASIVHYKISISLLDKPATTTATEQTETSRALINNYNGIASVYRSLKQWPQALYYSLKAKNIIPDDPDINNQLGVVYTEMRETGRAEECYLLAIKNYNKTFISTDSTFLLCELYLNYGHLHSYNGDNTSSIECYNKALELCPRFTLPFQNKVMNLSYIFDQLKSKMYITKQHKMINQLYEPIRSEFKSNFTFYRKATPNKIKIGIISGDFSDHPVSFFINTLLQNYDKTRFNVTCYSECIIKNENFDFKLIRGMSAGQAATLIYNDHIDILLDLAGHTAYNRLDVFALKPAPIQITYIGYPFSTGLNQMDYRITDSICDGDFSVSQKFYTEKLIALKNCFLCYDPKLNTFPRLAPAPFLKNGWITLGCFNRVNKMTESVREQFNTVLLKFPNIRFVFKTKALINLTVRQRFIESFDESVRDRITVLDCTITHEQHLLTYNQIDIAIDTFPYSGTTTSCEALLMGVPVLSMYDSTYFFHPQNVTCSILKNSNLAEYIFNNEQELHQKIQALYTKPNTFWKELKTRTRLNFTTGKVCNKTEYISNIQDLFTDLYTKL
jgi:predicted O-linked N-acetylglucosamine transferase (SPINDLY family)